MACLKLKKMKLKNLVNKTALKVFSINFLYKNSLDELLKHVVAVKD